VFRKKIVFIDFNNLAKIFYHFKEQLEFDGGDIEVLLKNSSKKVTKKTKGLKPASKRTKST